MAVNTQFSIAVHILAGLAYGCEARTGGELTSAYIAQSVNTSPSFIRRILSKLSKAGLVSTTTGKSGACRLGREPEKISLLDIYRAVDAPKVFSIHSYSEQKACVVSCHIKAALAQVLEKTQNDTEASLAKTTLGQIIKNVKQPAPPSLKSSVKPAAQSAAQPATKLVAQPAAKLVAQPADQPVVPRVAKPALKPS